jgi:hypothetical protein
MLYITIAAKTKQNEPSSVVNVIHSTKIYVSNDVINMLFEAYPWAVEVIVLLDGCHSILH